MNIQLDEQIYHVDGEKALQHISLLYDVASEKYTNAKIGKIDFSKKSLMRIAVKQIIATFLLPVLREMYEAKQFEMYTYQKHADVIDYFVHETLRFFGLLQKNGEFYASSVGVAESNIKNIITISTSPSNTTAISGQKEEIEQIQN